MRFARLLYPVFDDEGFALAGYDYFLLLLPTQLGYEFAWQRDRVALPVLARALQLARMFFCACNLLT